MKKIFLRSLCFLFLYSTTYAETPSNPALYRLDETLWSFKPNQPNTQLPAEIRILTPGYDNRVLDYQLANLVAVFFTTQKDLASALSTVLDLSMEKSLASDLRASWAFEDITTKWALELQKESPYDHNFNNLPFKVIQVKPGSLYEKASWAASSMMTYIKSWFGKGKPFALDQAILQRPWDGDAERDSFLNKGAFKDPFTQLAQEILQKYETPFISEDSCAGSYHFVLKEKRLQLEPIQKDATDFATDVIIAYRDFLKQAFGWRILDADPKLFKDQLLYYGDIFTNPANQEEQFLGYLSSTFGIDFEEMIHLKQPLLPDHVFKCNIAVGNVEMPMVESLYLRIVNKLRPLNFEQEIPLDTAEQFFTFLDKVMGCNPLSFSLREKRGLYLSFIKAGDPLTSAGFQNYLKTFEDYVEGYQEPGYGTKIRDLKPQGFQRLMDIFYADTGLLNTDTSSSPQDIFTGRKIVHLAISGYKTMGDKKTYDPSRNLFELLHIYPSLTKNNEEAFSELLAHIVAKKALWSEYPLRPAELSSLPPSKEQKDVRRVGRLIPFPDQWEGKRWYFVDGLLNDGAGDVNYVLVPACKGYMKNPKDLPLTGKRAPLIKLYRSTASDPEAESSIDSILADTNPSQIGSLNFKKGDQYENAYFSRCTIPVWAAYLVVDDIDKSVDSFQNDSFDDLKGTIPLTTTDEKQTVLTNFLAWQIENYASFTKENALEAAKNRLLAFIQKAGKENFVNYLTKTAQGMEWENSKIAQDIHFIGHSLGATLSQSGVYHFGAEDNRIPLYGCTFKCFAFDPPGVTEKEAKGFLDFGRKYKPLLSQFKQKWEIYYQFEYEDLVPQGGACYLGAQGYDTDQDWSWLGITAVRYKPLDSTKDLVLTTLPTHGRRFRHLRSSVDAQEVGLTPKELVEFKRNWMLPSELRKDFGYRWTTPFLSETLLRRGIPGIAAHGYYLIKKKFSSLRAPMGYEVDKDGVLFCTYKGYVADARP